MVIRRIGELFQLKYSHINQYSDASWYVIATEDITKTGIIEKHIKQIYLETPFENRKKILKSGGSF
jgi:hypothetical protein